MESSRLGRRRGFVDLYVDIVIAFVVMLVLSAVCLSLVASHAGV